MSSIIFEDKDFIVKQTRRDYVVIRKDYPYEFHSHFDSITGCRTLMAFYHKQIIPSADYYKIAMQRILTEEEYNSFNQKKHKPKYYNKETRNTTFHKRRRR